MRQPVPFEAELLHESTFGQVFLHEAAFILKLQDQPIFLTTAEFEELGEILGQENGVEQLFLVFASRKRLFSRTPLRSLCLNMRAYELEFFQQLIVEASLMWQVKAILS